MFPQGFTYSPGVVLDPVTMAPMITHGGNMSANAVGVAMKPEQRVWQKMFIKNIPQECTNENMIRLLNEFGNVKNFKRSLDNRGKLLPFCHFDLETGEEIIRIRRLFQNIKMLDRMLEIKISPETETFIKQWMAMQKEGWRKKLNAPGMNEAKQYESLQAYHLRDDKACKQRIQETLKQINAEVKKLAIERMREDQRRQHPKEREREKAKKRALEELERNFHQKEQHWLKRERDRERDQKREKDRQRDRERQRIRKLEKEMAMTDEEFERKASRFLTEERRKQLERQADQDIEVMMEENPPLPQEPMDVEEVKKVRAVIEEEEILPGKETVEEELVAAPVAKPEEVKPANSKKLQRNELFQGYQKIYEQKKPENGEAELDLPALSAIEVDEEEERRHKEKVKELQTMVPQNKMELWGYEIGWDKLAKSAVLDRYIRPWLQEMSNEYMGGVEEKFIALVEKKLLSRTHPDKIIKILRKLLEEDSEEFVVRLWKKLVLEYLKIEHGLS